MVAMAASVAGASVISETHILRISTRPFHAAMCCGVMPSASGAITSTALLYKVHTTTQTKTKT